MKKIHKDDIKAFFARHKEKRAEKKADRAAKKAARAEKFHKTKFYAVMSKACRIMNRCSLLMQAILSCVLYFLIELISRHSFIKAWTYMVTSPWTFLFNAYMIFATFLIVYIFRRREFARIVVGLVWLIIGGINGYILSVRVTPFNAQDLKVLDDAFSMIDKYLSSFQGLVIAALIVAVTVFLVFIWRSGHKYQGKMHRIRAIIFAVLGILSVAPLTKVALNRRVVSDYFGNIAFAYEDYGLPYCFTSSLINTGIKQSSNYNKKTIDDISAESSLSEVSMTGDKTPNIIMIQLESFFDPTEVEFLSMSEDPIPTFRSLMQNYSSGYFKVPSVGAGTANTEFEVLTGMNMRYFGPGEYPYKTVVKYRQMESAATAFREFGYGTHAIHNNGGNFYSRADVFDDMGFDSFTSEEFMNILQFTENDWAKDDVLTRHIVDALNSTDGQDFVFTITVQGHGDYPEEKVLENPRITVQTDIGEGKKNAWEYYVNQLYETDRFIADLLAEIEQRGEPTVVALYGDHLPTMGLKAKDLRNRYLYNTNYVIWDNIGLKKTDQDVPAYQLTSKIMESLGMHAGTLFNYHRTRRQTKNYLPDLELLQYDMLYGKGYVYGAKDYVTNRKTDYQMGLRDVTLSGIQVNPDGTYSMYGENMTSHSKIYVNGEKQSTQFLNNTRIELRKHKLDEGDRIVISQVGSASRVFRSSEEYVFSQGKLVRASEYVPPVIEEPSGDEGEPGT